MHQDVARVTALIWPDLDRQVIKPQVDVQQQTGGVDCGFFALAFAEWIARTGTVPTVQFDQSKLRQHMIECLQNNEITPFPLT